MTQKDKIMKAVMLAQSVRSTAMQIAQECRSYDERWALPYAERLEREANEFLKAIK